MEAKNNKEYPIAPYTFKCRATGYLVRKGDRCIEEDGHLYSLESANQTEE